jgi:opacity protein-like surface antigen
MLNDASFAGSPYRLRSSRVHHDDSVSGRRSASSFDGGHTGDQLERRLFTASPLDDRAHHEAKRSGLDAIVGNGIDGSEIVYIQFQEPFLTHGVGFTPKIKYMFEGTGRLRPYIEFAGGPFYTDLGGRIPEESSRFNFILTAGGGLSWFFTSQFSFNVGYRFHHISNAGTRMPNLGLNSSLPFGGFSFYF